MSRFLLRVVPFHASVRLAVAVVAGVVVGVALGEEALPVRLLAAWNSFAFVLLCEAWAGLWSCDAKATEKRAAGEDPGRSAIWLVSILASTVSLFAAVVVLRLAHQLAPKRAVLWVVLCLLAVALSWLVTQTSWTLRYAHLYYRDDEDGVGGLTFPGSPDPDGLDFAYFAFTIGICFQTSDISITSAKIRHAVLFHATLSFVYTTAILALALNLAFGFVT